MKIAITGGPSAGKTVIAETILREFKGQVAIVPEAASILFKGGFPRGKTPEHVTHQQIAIYHVQVQLEAIVSEENSGKLIICDRGTLDSFAYLQDKKIDFFKAVNSTLEKELKRYDCVFHLESAEPYNFDRSNPLRIEDPIKAREIDDAVKSAWAQHPSRKIINNTPIFSKKVAQALHLIEEILKVSSH